MQDFDTNTPVVLLHGGLGSLSIMRSLGSLGVAVHCVSNDSKEFSLRSRFCAGSYITNLDTEDSDALNAFLDNVAGDFDSKPLLIATSDELAIFVAESYVALSERYLIGQAAGSVVRNLADKKKMFELAVAYNVPVPHMLLPESRADLISWASEIEFPVMLKGIMGNRMEQRTGKKMVIVSDFDMLLEQYDILEDPDDPNLMVQEMIPGDDDQVFIFNGYFDENSECLAAFTGRKIRQYPVHTGCASLGECSWEPELAALTIKLMQDVGYRGILDIGYRRDPRDRQYKVLDINPRVGQAFRLFLATNGVDVIRAQYLHVTGQEIPSPVTPIEGRRWIIEDYDVVSSLDYWREGSLGLVDWVRSFRRLEEGAWFSWKDPMPFLLMIGTLFRKILTWAGKKTGIVR